MVVEFAVVCVCVCVCVTWVVAMVVCKACVGILQRFKRIEHHDLQTFTISSISGYGPLRNRLVGIDNKLGPQLVEFL